MIDQYCYNLRRGEVTGRLDMISRIKKVPNFARPGIAKKNKHLRFDKIRHNTRTDSGSCAGKLRQLVFGLDDAAFEYFFDHVDEIKVRNRGGRKVEFFVPRRGNDEKGLGATASFKMLRRKQCTAGRRRARNSKRVMANKPAEANDLTATVRRCDDLIQRIVFGRCVARMRNTSNITRPRG